MAKPKYTKWLTDDGLYQLKEWARQGLTNRQIAQNIKIKEQTLYKWINEHNELSEAIKRGRETPIANIENILYKKSQGYTDDEGVYHSPETTASIFLLKNWDRYHYKDRHPTKDEEESLKLDNKIKQFKIDELTQILTGDNPTIEKLELWLGALRDNAELNSDSQTE